MLIANQTHLFNTLFQSNQNFLFNNSHQNIWNMNNRALLSNNDVYSSSNSTEPNRDLKIEEIEPEIVNKKINYNESKSTDDLVLLPSEFKQMINLDDISSDDCDLCTKLFFSIIEWSFSLPLFNNLSQIDQINLLKNSWSDLFMICLAQCNVSIDSLSANLSNNNSINEDELLKDDISNNFSLENYDDTKNEKTALQLKTYLEKLRCLIENTNNDFYSYLKAVILFNPGKLI